MRTTFPQPARVLLCLAGVVFGGMRAHADVVINEIMYHPPSENPAEEFVELTNTGATVVDVSGWQFTKGVKFTIPAGRTITPGGYLVVAANAAAFAAKYPATTNFVAGWSGILSNSSDRLVLTDAAGTTRDQVTYADDGDWAERQKDVALDFGHRGWGWSSRADGHGASLELINPLFDSAFGQNWRASAAGEETPGAANSVTATDVAPVILAVSHFPLVPKSTEAVSVTARVSDATTAVSAVTLHYRNDGEPSWNAVPMPDDGRHGDGAAGDAVFGAVLPAQADGTIVEFCVEAMDTTGHGRTWPAPALDPNGAPSQSANCLYQVSDAVYPGAMPIYRVVMKAADRAELTQINTNSPAISGLDQTFSHARMNATFISFDGVGGDLRYLAGVRNRGNGSRNLQPQSFNVSFTEENPWHDRVALNLNSQKTPWQLFGSALYRQAGLAAPESRQVQLRVNAANPATSSAGPAYGFYVCNEVQGSDFADHHFPLDSSGNIYRGQRLDLVSPSGKTTLNGANLSFVTPGSGEPLTQVELYKLNYSKETNASLDDWTDLIALTQALAKGTSDAAFNSTYAADYATAVRARADVDEWMRFLAVNTLADNSETNISQGDGDDYYLYFGVGDPRAKFIPYDLDTIFGASSSNSATHGLFRMVQLPAGEPTPLNAFMKHPEFAPIYYRELRRQIDGAFAAARFDPFVDQVLGTVVDAGVVNTIKTFNQQRVAFVASQIPLALHVTAAPPALNGYPHTTTATANLAGTANAIDTRSVKVNGVAATWTAWTASWTASVALQPGINRLLLQAFDANGAESDRLSYDVWYDDASVVTAGGTLGANTTWTVGGGPYRVTSNLVVPSGVTLTIQPGATVYVATGATIQVTGTGKISAVGTETQRILFAHEPGAAGTTWGSLDFLNTSVESALSYVSFADCAGTTIGGHPAQVHVNNAIVAFDHLYFPPTPVQGFISFDASTFVVANSYFSTYAGNSGPESIHGVNGIRSGGYGIFRDNYFGHTYGYNDTIDFTGGNRPGPILQIIGNTFDGASDDCLDLDSTDAWIEGNTFLHAHRDPSRTDNILDTASAISGGVDTVGQNSDWTIINNLFYDVDHAVVNKGNSTTTGNGGGRVAFLHNTVVHVAKENSGSTEAEIAVFDWSDNNVMLPDASVGSGLYAAENIFYDCPVLQRFYDPAHLTVIFDNNILAGPWDGPGTGNRVVDPRLNVDELAGTAVADVTPAQFRRACALLPGSPAIGTGFGGRNLGGLQPAGIVISGEPSGTTNATSASLGVGPGGTFNWGSTTPQPFGWTAFKWKLDNGPWSEEIAVANPSPFAAPATIALSNLTDGPHTVFVIGRNDAGYYQDSPLVYPTTSSLAGGATASRTWTVDAAYVPPPGQANVRINEVLAKNAETQGAGGVFPDLIELYNAGTASANLGGWGISDTAGSPYRYAIPANTILAAGAYLVFSADSSSSAPAPRTGFGLSQSGETLTLTRSVAAGGGLVDRVVFGPQLPDYSIGRRAGDGQWDLCRPTFGAANVVAAQASRATLKINEWLASFRSLAASDFVEIFNPSALPVNLGGCYLTDNPVEWPAQHRIEDLTFLAGGGYFSFLADDNADQGAEHLNFKLAAEQGEIGLFNPAQGLIDNVTYGPQTTDVSEGRTPNGARTIAFFNQPTPGAPNPGISGGVTTTVNLIPAVHAWKYFASASGAPANDAGGRAFTEAAFDDAAWPGAGQMFYLETAALTNTAGFTKTTLLPGLSATKPYQTYYFRTHFTFSGNAAGTQLTATIMVDDGCVLYLNGQELVSAATGARLGLPAGAVGYSTLANRSVSDASVETVVLPGSALVAGDNVLVAEVHQANLQSSGTTSSDVVWGLKLDAVTTHSGEQPVVINEVFARNASRPNPDGSLSGWVELHNPSSGSADLSGMSLTNAVSDPRRFVFPANTTLPANGYLVLQCSDSVAANPTNTGFGLNGEGGGVYLFNTAGVGGGLRDSVTFGHQLRDLSIGRVADGVGAFTLTVPSRGGLNSAAGLAAATSVKINEWLAASSLPGLELFNAGGQPVLLGGNYLTDQLANRTKFLLPPLTFIGSTAADRWYKLIADNDGGATPGHVNFSLDPAGEAIGFYTSSGTPLDSVSFGVQTMNVSRGRYPDGTSAILSLAPTLGSANQLTPVDTDGDQIPDDYEIAHGLDPNDPSDAALDPDGDGSSNLAEYRAGTDPRNSGSYLKAVLRPGAGAGQFVIRFAAVAGKSYTVRYKNRLTDANWSKLADVPAVAADGLQDVIDNEATGRTERFYQVVTPADP